jgi:hypothetical protein
MSCSESRLSVAIYSVSLSLTELVLFFLAKLQNQMERLVMPPMAASSLVKACIEQVLQVYAEIWLREVHLLLTPLGVTVLSLFGRLQRSARVDVLAALSSDRAPPVRVHSVEAK